MKAMSRCEALPIVYLPLHSCKQSRSQEQVETESHEELQALGSPVTRRIPPAVTPAGHHPPRRAPTAGGHEAGGGGSRDALRGPGSDVRLRALPTASRAHGPSHV